MTIHPNPLPALEEAIKMLARISTATVTSQLYRRGILNVFIRGLHPLSARRTRFAAEAYTLRLIPMREDKMRPEIVKSYEYPQRKCIESCPAGQALVVDARGVRDAGIFGEILLTRLIKRGVAAVVCDGAMRDGEAILQLDLPVFATGPAAPLNLNAHFAPDLQQPIACGGTAVFPGDVLVGDHDGVVVVPRELAPEVARDGVKQEHLEQFIHQRILDGASTAGTYPPNAEVMEAYANGCKQQPL
jgi:regulator of RNase E activity RraA